MKIELASSLSNIDKNQWNKLNICNHPFTSYEFLNALETSNSVSTKTGWTPKHILVKNAANNLIGASPNYLKMHSYGEYIFDHSWANAFENAGGQYYPKLLSAIPFTPATGPRILLSPQKKKNDEIFKLIIFTYEQLVKNNNLSSAHMNFITKQLSDTLNKRNWIKREGLQFHWYNKKYQSFDDFLGELKSTKRKAIKKERKKINEYGLTIERLTGDALNVKIWDSFYEFYLSTIDKKWGGAYLTKDFFYSINRSMKNKILLVIAKKNNDIIAGALNFVGENTLYGRNWGSKLDVPFLHFELCYYQAIEYAIENKIQIVEAGAQGHHKIQRGYIATSTYSAHYIQNDSFDKAIRGFVEMEANEINKQIEVINQQGSPYSN
ncbi:GNAT family N-acetyltransferase [Candidatus Levibacter sp. Uisw_134_01]|uniref:GNAT family N-acetyltransferase n=1 Tax=Candidatus Levibacter sp. Uisw_134_01 TaxID=3230999 RepID=UPI003D54C4E2